MIWGTNIRMIKNIVFSARGVAADQSWAAFLSGEVGLACRLSG